VYAGELAGFDGLWVAANRPTDVIASACVKGAAAVKLVPSFDQLRFHVPVRLTRSHSGLPAQVDARFSRRRAVTSANSLRLPEEYRKWCATGSATPRT
jgi:hypothetical protein